MDDENGLKFGAFYWALPVFDVDFVPPGFAGYEDSDEFFKAANEHWEMNVQPARYGGISEAGNRIWYWLNLESDEWPARWVGPEIPLPSSYPGKPSTQS